MRRIAALCAILVLLAGCVPSVRLNERGVVQAIGIDLAEEGGYRVTMQVREAVDGAGGANQSPDDAKTMLVEETGRTMNRAGSPRRPPRHRGGSSFWGASG